MKKTRPASFILVASLLVPFVFSSCAQIRTGTTPNADFTEVCKSFICGHKQAAAGVLVDSDNDGVPDNYDNRDVYTMVPPYFDHCPGTPTGVKVDKVGCPLDTDGDGVPDYLDKCPGTPAGVKADKDGCPLDADGDGVPDYLDKCPGTPAGVKADKDGCPLDADGDGVPDYLDKCPGTPTGVKADKDGCPLDSDGDGVPDYLDKCPGTLASVKSDKDGCPLDSDGDGVPDYLDKCPGTPAGVKSDKDGCPPAVPIIEKGRVTLNVEFDFNKAVIKEKFHDDLGNLAAVMKKYPDLKIAIEGHTDNVGGLTYNEKLSQRRADAVKKYLVEKFGIEESRLTTKGYGPIRPIESNATKEGQQKNRRVEAAVEYIIKK